ncbi:MAG: hypothetical protein IRY85_14975 [Micromonosporaceae bacterium]|nr:hypothetical protein [Micromonosporaceae bacterium]
MSAETPTSSPRSGEHGHQTGVDERYAGTGYAPVQRGRLATVAAEHDARLARVAAEPTSMVPVAAATSAAPSTANDAPLSWAQDSGIMPVVSRQPRLRQMFGVCTWAAVLGVLGLGVGIRGLVAILMKAAPGWYEPAMIGVGFVGIGLTVGAFVTVYRRRLPYVLLAAATAVLAYAVLLTVTAV